MVLQVAQFVVGSGSGTTMSISSVSPQPVAAGGALSIYGVFPTDKGTPVVTLENGGSTPVATLASVTASASQVTATVPSRLSARAGRLW